MIYVTGFRATIEHPGHGYPGYYQRPNARMTLELTGDPQEVQILAKFLELYKDRDLARIIRNAAVHAM